ncbi:MAG: replicative helicase loader/inhibitor [Ruminococcus sp.]
MTKKEVAMLIRLVISSYPAFDKFRDREEVENTVHLWSVMFADDNRDVVTIAVKQHIATSKWPPSIAEIRELMLRIEHPEIIPPDEAWRAVNNVLYSEGQYFSGDIYRLLPEPIARAVEAVGYTTLWRLHAEAARGGKAGTDRLTFIQQYTPEFERLKLRAITPAAVNLEIDAIQAKLKAPERKKLEQAEQARKVKERLYAGDLKDNRLQPLLAIGE